MAIIDLGTKVLAVGSAPVFYDSFSVQGGRTYPIYADIDIDIPDNTYSFFEIKYRFSNGNMNGALSAETISLTPRLGISIFEIEVIPPVDNNTDLTIEVERVPIIFGTSDTAGTMTMRLFIDDKQDYISSQGG